MVTAILTKDIMIIGTGYLRGQDPIANFRKIMPHVKHVKLFISRTYFEWIPDTNKWTNITYDVTTVTQEQLGDTFSMAINYAADLQQPTLILIEVPFGQTI